LEEEEKFNREKEEIAFRKSKIDLINAERVNKTYKSTRFIALAGFIISLIGLCVAVAKALNMW
jgi:hypothetical protein